MRAIFFSLLLSLILTTFSSLFASTRNTTLKDTWSECDLMWFKPDNIQGSVNSFFDRYVPLFNDVIGEKGLILNTGWLVSPIACWTGTLSDKMYIPTFDNHHYPVWTYQNLKDLISALKNEASARGIFNFKVGVWMFGCLNPYHNNYDEWSGGFILTCSLNPVKGRSAPPMEFTFPGLTHAYQMKKIH